MKTNPMECLYCQNNDTLHSLMIEIAKLSVSRVFLFKTDMWMILTFKKETLSWQM